MKGEHPEDPQDSLPEMQEAHHPQGGLAKEG